MMWGRVVVTWNEMEWNGMKWNEWNRMYLYIVAIISFMFIVSDDGPDVNWNSLFHPDI